MYRCFYEPAVASAMMVFHGTLSRDDWQEHVKDVQRLGADRAAGAPRLSLLLVLAPGGGAPDATQRGLLKAVLERPEHDAFVALVSDSRLLRIAARGLSLRFRGSLRTFSSVAPALSWLELQREGASWLRDELGSLRGLVPERLLDA